MGKSDRVLQRLQHFLDGQRHDLFPSRGQSALARPIAQYLIYAMRRITMSAVPFGGPAEFDPPRPAIDRRREDVGAREDTVVSIPPGGVAYR